MEIQKQILYGIHESSAALGISSGNEILNSLKLLSFIYVDIYPHMYYSQSSLEFFSSVCKCLVNLMLPASLPPTLGSILLINLDLI